MRKSIAVITTFALTALTYAPSSAVASNSPALAELLVEDAYVVDGYEVVLAVTRSADGEVLGEATVVDPTSGDEIDVWSDGDKLSWAGVVDGVRVAGEIAVADLLADVEIGSQGLAAAFCFTPVTALVCIGAAAILLSGTGCAHFINCTPRKGSYPPDPCASGLCDPSESPEHGDGGGGDSSDDDEGAQ